MARPADDLRQLLLDRACTREITSKRFGVMLLLISVVMVAIAAWSAWYLTSKVQTNALYGLMGAYIVVLVLMIFYTSYNSIFSGIFLESPSSVATKVREWHKKGYKLLTGIVIIEHILLFCSLPIVLFHSLGLSMSRCLFGRTCTGITYSAWETVSMQPRTWVQQLITKPVSVTLSTAQLAMFGCFIAVLGTALIALVIYWYSEWVRRPSSDPTQSSESDTKPSKSLYIMFASSTLCVIFSIISLSVLKANWSVISLVLAILSALPLYQLKAISREPKITRLQFRNISQRCLALLFLWLYICGTGIATSLSVDLPLYTVSNSGYYSLIIDTTSIAQLVCLLVFHLLFSLLSASSLYFHLSLMDTIESYLKTDSEKEMRLADPVIVECSTPIQRQDSWINPVCASCCTNKNNTVLVPCGHSVVCSGCANALMGIPGFKCPLCCTEVFDSQRIS